MADRVHSPAAREERIVARYEAEGPSWPLFLRMLAHLASCPRCITLIIRNGGAITTHKCPGLGCKRQVGRGMLTCPGCWRTVPAGFRRQLWAAWDGGSGAGTSEHVEAMNDIIRYLAGGP